MSDEVKRELSDEELKEIEQQLAAARQYADAQTRGEHANCPPILANVTAETLLAEVKRLRSLMRGQTFAAGAPQIVRQCSEKEPRGIPGMRSRECRLQKRHTGPHKFI